MSKETVRSLANEFRELADARVGWDHYWREIAHFVLPQTPGFDRFLGTAPGRAMMKAVIDTPIAAERSKTLYDMTSLWGIERLSAGILTLKTPETSYWHDLSVDDDFGYEATHDEKEALERTRNYIFKVRSNPKSGYWSAHRAALKSMAAFGDGWMFIEEVFGGKLPYRYEYVPLSDMYVALGPDGMPNRAFRCFEWSAVQIMEKWPTCTHEKVIAAANDEKRRHDRFTVLHAVKPRPDGARIGKLGARGARFASFYCLPDEDYELAEGGFYEFPFARYAWSNNGFNPYCEGPVAIALGEIKSLNEMGKNELIASQALLRPALGVATKNMQRLNFNPGATNPGMVSPDGKPLFQALNTGVRPDFAAAIMEAKRNGVRELLYLNLWQILIDSPDMTATEALIRANEKGELLGPVGLSLNGGLSQTVDREIGILGRKGAFHEDAPLAMPESLSGRDVTPEFTSPLDRLRKVSEVIGMQRTLEFATALMGIDPSIKNRIDANEALDKAREILGAPASMLKAREEADKATGVENQMQQLLTSLAATEGAGRAAQAIGAGGAAMAEGAEAASASPALKRMLGSVPQPGGQPLPANIGAAA